MLERRHFGELSRKPHMVFDHGGKKAVEFVFTRDGFSGGFSILYCKNHPTEITRIENFTENTANFIGEPVDIREFPNCRRHIRTQDMTAGKSLFSARKALLRNATCRISVAKGQLGHSEDAFCNGDADELWFIKEGRGSLLTMFGVLDYHPGDYLLIPRGVAYSVEASGEQEALVIEGMPKLEVPQDYRNPYGQLKLEAPYNHRDFRSPNRFLSKNQVERFQRVLTLRSGGFTRHHYGLTAAETIGWDGSVYPIAFHILDYLPKTGKIHLPPNLLMTFQAPTFVVCSFVPRQVDYMEGAIPCPYPHANVACDEMLYYVAGDFTSRKGVGEKSISFHPAGLPHGPQPGRYHESVGLKSTDEVAVMVDTWEALFMTKVAAGLEDVSYQTSWGHG